MTRFDGAVEEEELRFGRGRPPRGPVGRGAWVSPLLGVLGVIILGAYLMTAHPSTPAATAPLPPSDVQPASVQAAPEAGFSKGTASSPNSGVAQNEWAFSLTTDLLKAAVGAALALVWAVGGAWFGIRRARVQTRFDEPADDMRTPGTGYHSLRAPTCERMYDKTRLVPYYLRTAKFPAMKQDLVRLAREHTDEGQALRRLECIPDRHYTSLHDLINEIRCD
jgi:hypothetical protein